jgi:hypothetical protein
VDCAWKSSADDLLVRQQNSKVRSKIGQLKVQTDLVWGTYVSEGKFTPARTSKWLFDLIDQGKALLAVDYVPCLDQTGVTSLRQACVEAYLAGYGYSPAGWASAWPRVWPDVQSPVSASLSSLVPGIMPGISVAITNKTRVAADTMLVEGLVQSARTALEKQNISWAKKNIEPVRAILVDGSGTKYVHAARIGGAIPQGVTGQEFGRLQKAAKALYAMLPRLEKLAATKLKIGTFVTPAFVPDEMPQEAEEGMCDLAYAWVKEHPWLSAAGLTGAAYLAWRKWGR